MHSNLGIILYKRGLPDEAIASCRQALWLRPDLSEAHGTLGAALKERGQLDEAIAHFREAVRLQPNSFGTHNNLGRALAAKLLLEESIASYRRALDLRPDVAQVYSNMATALSQNDQLDEALAACRQALRLQPELAAAQNALGMILKDMGLVDEAVAAARRAVELDPASPAFHSNLVYAFHFHEYSDPELLSKEARDWYELHAARLADRMVPHPNEPDSERRLRVGYVSPDLRGHPVGLFLLPLLNAHDRSRVEIFCYASVEAPDFLTERLRRNADSWRDVAGWCDDRVAQQVRADRIDILVDLSAHMGKNRLLVFTRKPAPVQVTYLGYSSTTGAWAIDYRLTDPFLDPPSSPSNDEIPVQTVTCYTEQSVWLPETYWCYQPVNEVGPSGPLPALAAGHVTFGCLNNFCKITGPTLELWSELLHRLPDARLLLHAKAGSHRDRVRGFFAAYGVGPERIAFVSTVPYAEYLALYREIDVGLDPFPYGGGTTTCDALWMGVPVVSLVGRTAVSRAGLSITCCWL